MLENEIFEFYRGDTYQRDFTVTGWSFPVSNVFFTVKENEEFKNAALQKTLGNGIALVSDEDGIQTYNLLISSTDTDRMKTDYDYIFDIEIHSEGVMGEILKKTIITGIVRLKGSATKRINE